jgi:hypothetical protein
VIAVLRCCRALQTNRRALHHPLSRRPPRRRRLRNLADAIQTLGFRLPKKPGRIAGGELRGDSAILNLEGELFEGQHALFLVRMVKDGSRWVFDRALNAGLIDP